MLFLLFRTQCENFLHQFALYYVRILCLPEQMVTYGEENDSEW